MEKKRILFVHHVSAIGGGSYCLLNLVKGIDIREFDPIVLLCEDGPLKQEFVKIGVKVLLFNKMHTVPYNKDLLNISSILRYSKVLRSRSFLKQILVENAIDILYLNNMMLYPYLKPAKEVGVKTIIHIREHWPLDEHKCQLEWARKNIYRYADQIIAINEYSALMFPKRQAAIIYDWIDMNSRFKEMPLNKIFGEESDTLKIYLYTGGLQPIKGAIEVLDAFIDVINDSNSRLLVIGIEPTLNLTGMKGKIKKILSRFGLDCYEIAVKKRIVKDKRIVCIPATYYLSHIIQQSYCNLSFFTIPHANLTLAECEILGTPSVVACTSESLEYSLNGELSVLYKLNDKKGFHHAIRILDEKYDIVKRNLVEKSSIIEQMFSPEVNIKKLDQIMKSL